MGTPLNVEFAKRDTLVPLGIPLTLLDPPLALLETPSPTVKCKCKPVPQPTLATLANPNTPSTMPVPLVPLSPLTLTVVHWLPVTPLVLNAGTHTTGTPP